MLCITILISQTILSEWVLKPIFENLVPFSHIKLSDTLCFHFNQICAFKNDTDSYGGDSRGPVTICDDTKACKILIGEVSYGRTCADGK